MRNDGKIPYLEKYPEANSDSFTQDKCLQLCQTGFHYVLKYGKVKSFQIMENQKCEKLELYVFVNPSSSEDKSKDDVMVRPAYKCPTIPSSYVHINSDPSEGENSSFWIILKDSAPEFNFNRIKEYHLQLADEIREGKVTRK